MGSEADQMLSRAKIKSAFIISIFSTPPPITLISVSRWNQQILSQSPDKKIKKLFPLKSLQKKNKSMISWQLSWQIELQVWLFFLFSRSRKLNKPTVSDQITKTGLQFNPTTIITIQIAAMVRKINYLISRQDMKNNAPHLSLTPTQSTLNRAKCTLLSLRGDLFYPAKWDFHLLHSEARHCDAAWRHLTERDTDSGDGVNMEHQSLRTVGPPQREVLEVWRCGPWKCCKNHSEVPLREGNGLC